MYSKILIGYDDSEYSLAAVKEVAAWLCRHEGEAKIIHAVYFDEEEFGIKPEMLGKRVAEGETSCRHAQKVAADFGVTMQASVKEGVPPELITDLATRMGCDLIALGTYGRRGISRLLIGSVTTRVILNAPCDVLVVKRPCGDNCTGRYSNIIVPFDGSSFSRRALERACQLARVDASQVTALYVLPRYEEMMDFFKTEAVRNSLQVEAEKILSQAQDVAARLNVALRTVIDGGYPADSIAAAAIAGKTDLIVMGTHGWRGIDRSIMGSTAERVIMTAHCPVLVIR